MADKDLIRSFPHHPEIAYIKCAEDSHKCCRDGCKNSSITSDIPNNSAVHYIMILNRRQCRIVVEG